MKRRAFAETILGEAVDAAVTDFSRQLNTNASRLPGRTVTIDGLVADATGNTLALNVGSRAGLKVGGRLQVRRNVRDIQDPATGKVLRSIDNVVGEPREGDWPLCPAVACLSPSRTVRLMMQFPPIARRSRLLMRHSV